MRRTAKLKVTLSIYPSYCFHLRLKPQGIFFQKPGFSYYDYDYTLNPEEEFRIDFDNLMADIDVSQPFESTENSTNIDLEGRRRRVPRLPKAIHPQPGEFITFEHSMRKTQDTYKFGAMWVKSTDDDIYEIPDSCRVPEAFNSETFGLSEVQFLGFRARQEWREMSRDENFQGTRNVNLVGLLMVSDQDGDGGNCSPAPGNEKIIVAMGDATKNQNPRRLNKAGDYRV